VIIEPNTAIGIFLRGFFVSSPRVAAASNPRKLKIDRTIPRKRPPPAGIDESLKGAAVNCPLLVTCTKTMIARRW
jgi:hypothetical protein